MLNSSTFMLADAYSISPNPQESANASCATTDALRKIWTFWRQYRKHWCADALGARAAFEGISQRSGFPTGTHRTVAGLRWDDQAHYALKRLTSIMLKPDGCTGPQIYLRREDLNHGRSPMLWNRRHCWRRMNWSNALLRKRGAWSARREAPATVCARFWTRCVIYTGRSRYGTAAPERCFGWLMGGGSSPVAAGAGTLKDHHQKQFRDWVTNAKKLSITSWVFRGGGRIIPDDGAGFQ